MSRIPQILRNANKILLTHKQPKYSLIWLHGQADSPESYLPLFTNYRSPLYQGCRIVLPQAPIQLNSSSRQTKSNWYDLSKIQENSSKKEEADALNVDILQGLMQEQMHFWQGKGKINPRHRVYFGGMGQGATTALHYSLTFAQPPAGVIGISGQLLSLTQPHNLRKLPILLLHGKQDNVIPTNVAKRSYKRLLQDQFLVEFKEIDNLFHGVNLQCLQIMKKWMGESHQYIRNHYQGNQQAGQSL